MMQATATDNVAVASVSFTIDSTLVGTATVPPYELASDTSAFGDGAHVVTATATDSSDNSAASSVSVTVNNGASRSMGLPRSKPVRIRLSGCQ